MIVVQRRLIIKFIADPWDAGMPVRGKRGSGHQNYQIIVIWRQAVLHDVWNRVYGATTGYPGAEDVWILAVGSVKEFKSDMPQLACLSTRIP